MRLPYFTCQQEKGAGMSVLRLCLHSLSTCAVSAPAEAGTPPAPPSTPFGEGSEYVGEFMGESRCASLEFEGSAQTRPVSCFYISLEMSKQGGRLSGVAVANREKRGQGIAGDRGEERRGCRACPFSRLQVGQLLKGCLHSISRRCSTWRETGVRTVCRSWKEGQLFFLRMLSHGGALGKLNTMCTLSLGPPRADQARTKTSPHLWQVT